MPPQEKWKTRSREADWSETRDQARGRGAMSNATGRFEKQYAEPFDDGWDNDEKLPTLKTETMVEKPKTIITYNLSLIHICDVLVRVLDIARLAVDAVLGVDLEAVSYTHLDVYKRQARRLPAPSR